MDQCNGMSFFDSSQSICNFIVVCNQLRTIDCPKSGLKLTFPLTGASLLGVRVERVVGWHRSSRGCTRCSCDRQGEDCDSPLKGDASHPQVPRLPRRKALSTADRQACTVFTYSHNQQIL